MKQAILQPIKRPKLTEQVEKEIKALIFHDKLEVGEKLPSEQELAEQLQVGRRSVREALQSLERMGLIEIKHGKGTFVSQPKLDNYLELLAESINFRLLGEKAALLQLLEVRKLLGAGIASLSASRATSYNLRAMEKALHLQKKAIKTKNSEIFNVTDLDFHNAVVKGSQNDILTAVYSALSNLMLESRRRTNKIPGVAEESLKDHQKIFLAIKSGNGKLAHHDMFTHIDKTEQNMKKIFIPLEKASFSSGGG